MGSNLFTTMIHLYAGLLGLHTLLFSVSLFSTPLLVLAQDQRPKSALEWITVDEAKKLPNGFLNENLLRNGLLNLEFKHYFKQNFTGYMFCRARKDGCMYPGKAYYSSNLNNNGIPYCTIITKEKLYRSVKSFQLLYNPNGAAQVTWLPWNKGKGKFPSEVVKSDEYPSCNFMLGRYKIDGRRRGAMVDSDGYVYYLHNNNNAIWNLDWVWAWDNNEYDLLIERTAKGQLISKCLFGVFKSTKKSTKLF